VTKSNSTHIEFIVTRGCRDRDRMVIGFITTYAISVYHN